MGEEEKEKGIIENIVFIEEKWNSIYQHREHSEPANVLLENYFLLPKQGVALDLACGLGANALFLAKMGLTSHAWDISPVALKRLKQKASKNSVNISTQQGFIDQYMLPKNTFDVIVISRFLDRNLSNAIMESLKPNGLLFYQTFVQEKVSSSGPKNKEFLLARNELIELFKSLTIVFYQENSLIGDLVYGERDEPLFIGQKGEN